MSYPDYTRPNHVSSADDRVGTKFPSQCGRQQAIMRVEARGAEQQEVGVSFGDLVQKLQKDYALEAALVVTADGLIVDAATASGTEIDAEAIAANAVSGLLMLEALGQELASTPRQAIIEFDRHLVLVTPLDQDTALVLVAAGSTNLGRLRLAVRRLGIPVSHATQSAGA